MTSNNLQIIPSYVTNDHEMTRKRNLSKRLIHYPISIIDQKTRTKARRSTRDADKENKPRPLLSLCCSRLVSLTDPGNREVMSIEKNDEPNFLRLAKSIFLYFASSDLPSKSICSNEDECRIPDATTYKLFLPTLRTIMKGLEDETCPQC
jgi:hypothetical protein